MKLTGFDATTYEPLTTFEPVPADTYRAMIVGEEMKATKSGDGEMLSLTWQIVGGQYDGRFVFENLNLKNPNPKAVQIAEKTLAAICLAVGVPRPQDSAELMNKPIMIKVVQEKRKDTGEMANRVKDYVPNGQTGPATPAQPVQQQAPQAQDKLPWQ